MKPSNWKDYVELVGILAIVLSLVFVGLQLRQSQDIVLSELDVAIAAVDAETTASIGDHADVWTRGNSGAELSEVEMAFYKRLVYDIRSKWVTSYRRNSRFGREFAARHNVGGFAMFLHANPGARQVFMSWREDYIRNSAILELPVYVGGFNEAVLADLQTLDQATK